NVGDVHVRRSVAHATQVFAAQTGWSGGWRSTVSQALSTEAGTWEALPVPHPPRLAQNHVVSTEQAQLKLEVLAGWQRMLDSVPGGPRRPPRMASHFGLPLDDVQHLNDIRNIVAHPTTTTSERSLMRAARIARRAAGQTTTAPRSTPDTRVAPAEPMVADTVPLAAAPSWVPPPRLPRPPLPAPPYPPMWTPPPAYTGPGSATGRATRFAASHRSLVLGGAVCVVVLILIVVVFGPVGLLVAPLVALGAVFAA